MRKLLLLGMLALAGCIPKVDPPNRAPKRTVSSTDRQPDPKTLQCHADMRKDEIGFRVLPDRLFSGGCSAVGTVQLLEVGTPVTNLGPMTCPLAHAFARWLREAVQPAAGQWLKSRVTRIESLGTYSCRPVNGQTGARLSEHGLSNAVDVAAFVLADGRRVTLKEGWNGGDEAIREFLRTVHRAGCRRFQTGLGPEANALHADHFHFDMGRGPYCR